MSILYLACPFTHPDPAVQEHRYRTSCMASAKLMKAGIVVFNPLGHSVAINEFLSDVDSHEFWMTMDIPMLQLCDELLILGLPGWTDSSGVKAEMFKALAWRKPITLIEEADIDLLPKIPKNAAHYLESEILTEVADDT